MIPSRVPEDEPRRLAALRLLGLLDTPPEERFDRITRLAQYVFEVPLAAVSLVDAERQWLKSCQGPAVREMPRDISFCSHAILGDGALVVPDALHDERFADNPLVTHPPRVRFYAGHPLSAADGSRIGTLCILDYRPRALGEDEIQKLADLAALAEHEIQLSGRAEPAVRHREPAAAPCPAPGPTEGPVAFDLLTTLEEVVEEMAAETRRRGSELIVRYPPYVPRHLVGDLPSVYASIRSLIGRSLATQISGYLLISAECIERSGTRVRLRLAVEETCSERVFDLQLDPEGHPERLSAELLGARVLIADGFDARRRVLREMLTGWGMRCVGARCAAEALASLRKGQSEGDPFSILVLPHTLPDSDGERLARFLRVEGSFAELSTLLLASPASQEEAESVRHAVIDACLTSPVRQSSLRRAVAGLRARQLHGQIFAPAPLGRPAAADEMGAPAPAAAITPSAPGEAAAAPPPAQPPAHRRRPAAGH